MLPKQNRYGAKVVPVPAQNGIDKWFIPLHIISVTKGIPIDKAGRVVLPKVLRDELRLAPRVFLQLESEGERITLRPGRPQATLRKEYGIWVYQGEPTEVPIPDLIGRERERRIREQI